MPAAFRIVPGEAFATLAPAVRRLHASIGSAVWNASVAVRRGCGLLARCCAWMAGLPPGMGESTLQKRCSGGDGRKPGNAMFDGVCRLCNGWVRFLLRHDLRRRYRFAAMQDDAGRALLQQHGPGRCAVDASGRWRSCTS